MREAADEEERVRGYLGVVYGAAVRQMRGDGSGAEDVTQAVMMVMLRKKAEGRLPEEKFMMGWLLKVTGYAVREYRVRAGRRAKHEAGAAREKVGSQESGASSQKEEGEVRAVLDEALLALGSVDREVVVRRYLRGESLVEVGKVVGMNENTVGRRIARAVEKLRKVMGRRGVVAPVGVVVGVMVGEMGVKVPAAMAAGMGGGGVVTGLAKAVFWRMAMAKVFAGVAASVVVLAVSGAVVAEMKGKAEVEVARAASAPSGLPFVVSKETTGIVSPLHADGTPDYVEALNAKYGAGVTAENNGFVTWLEGNYVMAASTTKEVFARTGARRMPEGVKWGYQDYLHNELKLMFRSPAYKNVYAEPELALTRMWSVEEFPELAGHMKKMEQMEPVVEEVLRRPKWWAVLTEKNLEAAGNSWGEDDERETALLFCARGLMRAKQGDFSGFVKDVRVGEELFGKMCSDPTSFQRRIRATYDVKISQAIGAVVGSGTLTNEQLKEVRVLIGEMKPLEPTWTVMDEWARWHKLETVQRFSRGDREEMKWIFAELGNNGWKEWAVDPVLSVEREEVDWNVALRQINVREDEEVAMAKAGDYRVRRAKGMEQLGAWRQKMVDVVKARGEPETWFAKDAGETREGYSKRVGEEFFLALSYEIEPVLYDGQTERAELQREMLGVLVGAAEYKARTGKWPEKVEDAGVKLPLDMYGEDVKASVQYVHGEVGARIYSVGANGVDDGGVDDGLYLGSKVDDFGVGVVEGQ